MVVDPESPRTTTVLLFDRLFVGRECAGVDDAHRVILSDDLSVSRNHLEFRVDTALSEVLVIDTSSNGVWLNGVRIERSVGVPLRSGDRIRLGSHVLEFRSSATAKERPAGTRYERTHLETRRSTMCLVVGDLIGFSTIAESADGETLARDVSSLYSQLRDLLKVHHGTLVDYVGDAFFASWETESDAGAVVKALNFALEADDLVRELAPALELRHEDGSPLRMGWAVALGEVVVQLMPGSVVMVLGDAVNVGFRLAGLAGRTGRPSIVATAATMQAAPSFGYGPAEVMGVKGRVGSVTIYGVSR